MITLTRLLMARNLPHGLSPPGGLARSKLHAEMGPRSQLIGRPEQLVSGIALIFGLQLFRSFIALSTFVLHDVRRWSPLLLLVLMAAFLSTPILAGPLARRLGRSGARNMIVAALLLTRLGEQLVERPELDVWLAGLGCSLLWILLSLLADDHDDLPDSGVAGLLLVAVVADSALLASLRTLDLSWQPLAPFPVRLHAGLLRRRTARVHSTSSAKRPG